MAGEWRESGRRRAHMEARPFQVTDCYFRGNSGDGGALYIVSSQIVVEDSTYAPLTRRPACDVRWIKDAVGGLWAENPNNGWACCQEIIHRKHADIERKYQPLYLE